MHSECRKQSSRGGVIAAWREFLADSTRYSPLTDSDAAVMLHFMKDELIPRSARDVAAGDREWAEIYCPYPTMVHGDCDGQ
jgi:hypothetical protein